MQFWSPPTSTPHRIVIGLYPDSVPSSTHFCNLYPKWSPCLHSYLKWSGLQILSHSQHSTQDLVALVTQMKHKFVDFLSLRFSLFFSYLICIQIFSSVCHSQTPSICSSFIAQIQVTHLNKHVSFGTWGGIKRGKLHDIRVNISWIKASVFAGFTTEVNNFCYYSSQINSATLSQNSLNSITLKLFQFPYFPTCNMTLHIR